jgi:hypothetical protein
MENDLQAFKRFAISIARSIAFVCSFARAAYQSIGAFNAFERSSFGRSCPWISGQITSVPDASGFTDRGSNSKPLAFIPLSTACSISWV